MGKERLTVLGIILLILPGLVAAYFSTSPHYTFRHSNESGFTVSFKHTTKRKHECTEKERAEYVAGFRNLKAAQKATVKCGSRERFPLALRIVVDGREILKKEAPPAGLRKDSAMFIYERFYLVPALHHVEVHMDDACGGADGKYAFNYAGEIPFEQGGLVVIDFDGASFKVKGVAEAKSR